MAEWLLAEGVAATRALLVDGDRIIRHLYRAVDDGVVAGTVCTARLTRFEDGLATVSLPDGEEAILSKLPPGISIGSDLLVTITRSAIDEAGLRKRAVCRASDSDAREGPAAGIQTGIEASGLPVRTVVPHGRDLLAEAGWGELCDAAASGHWPFPGGLLRLSLTPAMAVIDVDGTLPAASLAIAGAHAAAQMVQALDIGGNIVIDLPTLAGKAERIAAAEAFDAALPPPFERTAVNGYGLMQVIRPRTGPSLAERWQFRPVAHHAHGLCDQAERHASRTSGAALCITAAPAVIGWLEQRPALLARLAARCGRPIDLHGEPGCAIGAGHVS